MTNQKILIIILIAILVIFKFFGCVEGFDSNNYPCATNSSNSNCTCPEKLDAQRVLGKYPMNYGNTSPYTYSCATGKETNPNTNVYPNPPE